MTSSYPQQLPAVSGRSPLSFKGFSRSGQLSPTWHFNTTLVWGFAAQLVIIASGK
ncbi:MAG: hypothetical protein ACO1O1_13835 [Adhaeribacter sp.]